MVRTYTHDVKVVKVFGYLEEIKNKGAGCIKGYNIERGSGEKGKKREMLNLSGREKPSQPSHPSHGGKRGETREERKKINFF